MLRKSDGAQVLTTKMDRSSGEKNHQKTVPLTRQNALEPPAINQASNALPGDSSAHRTSKLLWSIQFIITLFE